MLKAREILEHLLITEAASAQVVAAREAGMTGLTHGRSGSATTPMMTRGFQSAKHGLIGLHWEPVCQEPHSTH